MSNPVELIKPSVAEVRRAEEAERQDRLHAGDNQACLNAFKVAGLVKGAEFPLKHNKGTSKWLDGLEEQERLDRLQNREASNNARILAASISKGLLSSRQTHIIPSRRGTSRWTASLEEGERRRRLADTREAGFRQKNAHILSDSIRTNGAIIRARLIKRRPIVEKSKEALNTASVIASDVAQVATDLAATAYSKLPSKEEVSVVAHDAADLATAAAGKVYSKLPSKDEVSVAAHDAAVAASGAAHAAADAVAPVAAAAASATVDAVHKLQSFLPSFSDISKAVGNAVGSVQHAAEGALSSVQHTIYGDEELHDFDRATVRSWEEQERARRIAEDRVGHRRANARIVSLLVTRAKFPTLSRKAGMHKYINSIEESERTRRMANKFESDAHIATARKVSNLLSALGWPFIAAAKSSKQGFSETWALEEGERRRRMASDFVARYNARKVSGLVKNSLPASRSKIVSHIGKLEEKERAYRLQDKFARANARREAQLIESLGWPFFANAKNVTFTENVSQAARDEQAALAREDSLRKLHQAEEEERQFRINQQKFQQQKRDRKTQLKAVKVAQVLRFDNNTFDEEETPLLNKSTSAFDYGLGSRFAHDTNILEESERKSRLGDKDLAQMARSNAFKVSSMIKKRNSAVATPQLPQPHFQNSGELFAPRQQLAQQQLPQQPIAAPRQLAPQPIAQQQLPQQPIRQQPLPQQQFAAPLAKPTVAAPLPQQQFAAPLAKPIVAAPLPQQQFVAPQQQFVAPPQQQFAAPQQQFVAPQQQFVAPLVKPTTAVPLTQTTTAVPIAKPLPVMSTVTSIPPPSQGLLDQARKMYEQELMLADAENKKAAVFRSKRGMFSKVKLGMAEKNAKKHLMNAKTHEQWINQNQSLVRPNVSGMSAM